MKDQNGETLRVGQQVLVRGLRDWYLGSVKDFPDDEDLIPRPFIERDSNHKEYAVDPDYIIGLEYNFMSIENALIHLILNKGLFSAYLDR